MNDHIDGHYELHLLIFKMSNGSSYYEAFKRLLTPHVRASQEKEKISLPLILYLFLSFSQLSYLISSSLLYIKVRYIPSLLLWFALYLSLFYNTLSARIALKVILVSWTWSYLYRIKFCIFILLLICFVTYY